jgi:hypothetical protein
VHSFKTCCEKLQPYGYQKKGQGLTPKVFTPCGALNRWKTRPSPAH